MTIQRLYSLPNCKLILEGLGDATLAPTTDGRPLVSMLVNAECHLAATDRPLTGGRDFLESLVTAVSTYAQEFLSKVQPTRQGDKSGLVQLHQLDERRHRLTVHSEIKPKVPDAGSSSTAPPIEIDLTTVQLFDLVEAVDQFIADSQTLPDISLPLVPISKRAVSSSQLVAKQAIPATVGFSGLALAAIAFFFIPVPPKRLPQPQPQYNPSSINRTTPAPKAP